MRKKKQRWRKENAMNSSKKRKGWAIQISFYPSLALSLSFSLSLDRSARTAHSRCAATDDNRWMHKSPIRSADNKRQTVHLSFHHHFSSSLHYSVCPNYNGLAISIRNIFLDRAAMHCMCLMASVILLIFASVPFSTINQTHQMTNS